MKKLKLVILSIVVISMLFVLTGCTSSEAETERQFVKIGNEGAYDICYHKQTKVMYVVSNCFYVQGVFTLLVDAEGKPLLYEGE